MIGWLDLLRAECPMFEVVVILLSIMSYLIFDIATKNVLTKIYKLNNEHNDVDKRNTPMFL